MTLDREHVAYDLYTLRCDVCGAEGPTADERDKAIIEAIHDGWNYKLIEAQRTFTDYCPNCWARRTADAPASVERS